MSGTDKDVSDQLNHDLVTFGQGAAMISAGGVDVITIETIERARLALDAAPVKSTDFLFIDEAADLTPEILRLLEDSSPYRQMISAAPTGSMMLLRGRDTPTSPGIFETYYPDPWPTGGLRRPVERIPQRMAPVRHKAPRKNKAQRKARKIMRQSK